MVESGETEGGKNTASFHFEHNKSPQHMYKEEASRFKVISSEEDIAGSLYTGA